MSRWRHHSPLLRLLVVMSIVSGLLLQPVIEALGELHAFEHATSLDGDHGGDLLHGHERHSAHSPPTPVDGSAPEDLSGLHGLLHGCVNLGAVALFDLPSFGGSELAAHDPATLRPDVGPFAGHANSPFRPPIA